MPLSEDRISTIAHQITGRIGQDNLAAITDERRFLICVKQSLEAFFGAADEIDEAVRAKLRNKAPGSRDWEALYQKFYQEEMARRKL